MIEFVLIFALGFLAAALIGMLITPAIYSRIVRLTEKRIRATVPLSASEIRGKSDLLRARHASETAKLSARLKDEQKEVATSKLANSQLREALANLAGEKSEADRRIDELMTHSAELRSETRKQQQLIEKLSGDLSEFEQVKKADTEEIIRLNNDLMTISTEVESMKIDLATSGTESVSHRSEIQVLQKEQANLQSALDSANKAASELEQEFAKEQQQHNDTRLNLAASQSSLVDAEMRIEALETGRRELEDQNSLERERHNETRIELAAMQSSLTDAEIKLGDAREQIDTLNSVRQELQEDIRDITHSAQALNQERELEEERHANTRIELAAAQSSLADMEFNLGQAQERIEALNTMHRDQQHEIVTLKDSALRLQDQLGDEQGQHKATRDRLANVELDLGQANKKVEALESVRQELQDEISTLAGTMDDLRHKYGLEQSSHENTRAELAEARTSLADIEAELVLSNQKVETLGSVRQELQSEIGTLAAALERRRRDHVAEPGDEADREKREQAEEAERRILALSQKLESARDALEKSKASVGELKATIVALKSEEQALRAEAAKTAHHAKELERRLSQAGFSDRERDTELEEIRAALEARNRELHDSRQAAGALELQLREKQAQVEDLDRKLSEAESLLHMREQELAESGLQQTDRHPVGTGPLPISPMPTDTAENGAPDQGSRLETQIDALKTALQRSKVMSGQFKQQLNRMRSEVGQHHRGDRTDEAAGGASANGADSPALPVADEGLGHAMRSDAGLRDRVSELRRRQQALLNSLRSARDNTEDKRLREEITDIAAIMIGLSGGREGDASPLLSMIDHDGPEPSASKRRSLADRARSELDR